MIRQTSFDIYRTIRENGLLSRRRLEVYGALFEYGPCTASELFYKMQKSRNPSHSNVTTRLGELRDAGVVDEMKHRECSITGVQVIEWDVTSKLPAPVIRLKRIKCNHCDGTGYLTDEENAVQTRIYVVVTGDDRRLVEASSAAQAIRHCVKGVYNAKVANTKEIAGMMKSGLQVEQATETESNGHNAPEKQGEE